MNEAEALARLRLARTDGIGTVRFRALLERFGSGLAALEALPRWPARRDGGCDVRAVRNIVSAI